MTTKSNAIQVFVFRCNNCGLEYFSRRGAQPVSSCGRCGRTFLPRRVIVDPHANTLALAEREDASRAE